MAEDDSRRGVYVSKEISLGAILQAGVVAAGLIAFAVTAAGRSEQTQKDVASLQAQTQRDIANLKESIAGQQKDIRDALTSGLADVRQQLVGLPDYRARLDQMERTQVRTEARQDNSDKRLDALERAVIENTTNLQAIVQASGAQVPRAPRLNTR